jgi:hypothetical protein
MESRGMRLQPAEQVDLADGTPAYLFEATVAHPEDPGIEVRSVQLFAVHDGLTYGAIANTDAVVWSRDQAQLRESVASLRFD